MVKNMPRYAKGKTAEMNGKKICLGKCSENTAEVNAQKMLR
jgi:hypothetical protein